MQAPKSEKAVKILSDPESAQKLAAAIRAGRSRRLSEFDAALDGKKLILREVIKTER